MPPPLPDAGDGHDGVVSDESFFDALGRRPPGAGGGGNGASSVTTHHAEKNGSTPDHCPYSSATAGGSVAMVERWSGDADSPNVDAVGDDNVVGWDCPQGGNGSSNDNADRLDDDSNGSIHEMDLLG